MDTRFIQLAMDNFLVQRGTPKYLIGSEPRDRPVETEMESISDAFIPEAKNAVLLMLMETPKRSSNYRAPLRLPEPKDSC